MSNLDNTSSSDSAIPSGAQLAETRLKRWHQQGEALLTMENLRSWINTAGLVLFAPRPQIVAPAATLVEAVLGEANANPTLAQTAVARGLLGRLVAEGLAVPLNLMGPVQGAAGDTPDFVASTAVFSYVFTLRGDKAWKQPPATTGPLKVSHLALAVHEALARRGATTAFDLAIEVGKEATEAAVLRALGELWAHLRVLPLAQADGKAAVWELTSARFIKQMKAGANAGQPSALSALISLYLGQAVVAAEEEVEGFLSPLAPRSRIRDVVRALLSARQLETIAIEGRTMLHVAGELPAFLAAAQIVPDAAIAPAEAQGVALAAGGEAATEAVGTDEGDGAAEAEPRITKFIPKPRKIGTGYLAKAKPAKFAVGPGAAKRFPAPKTDFGGGFKGGSKPRAGAGPAPDRERRPFSKAKMGGFDKPWEEEKARRLAAASRPSEVSEGAGDAAATGGEVEGMTAPRTPRVYKPRSDGKPRTDGKPRSDGPRSFKPRGDRPGSDRRGSEGTGERRGFAAKPKFAGRPAFGGKPKFGGRPARDGEGGPARREFAARGEGGDARPARKTFSKPGTFGRKRDERAGGDRPARTGAGSFAPRKPFGARTDGPRKFAGKPSFAPGRGAGKSAEGADGGAGGAGGKRVYRKFDAPRDGARRPAARKFDGPRDRGERPARADGASGRAGRPSGDFAPRKFAGKAGGFGGKAGGKPASKSSGGGFAGKKPFGKSGKPFGGKPASTFAKFAGGKKPFGKRPPARKFKPKEGESA